MNRAIPVLFDDLSECCGCTACAAICPRGAISMWENLEGFDYPHINSTLCVGCLLCVEVCPFRSEKDGNSR